MKIIDKELIVILMKEKEFQIKKIVVVIKKTVGTEKVISRIIITQKTIKSK
jgi:hypothetical protein